MQKPVSVWDLFDRKAHGVTWGGSSEDIYNGDMAAGCFSGSSLLIVFVEPWILLYGLLLQLGPLAAGCWSFNPQSDILDTFQLLLLALDKMNGAVRSLLGFSSELSIKNVQFFHALKLDTGVRRGLTSAFWTSRILSAELLPSPFGTDFFPNTFLKKPLNVLLKIKQTKECERTFIRTQSVRQGCDPSFTD